MNKKINIPHKFHAHFALHILTILIMLAILFFFSSRLLQRGYAVAVSNTFVTRNANQLILNGKQWRFSGADMYWLGLDDNIRDGSGNPTYPSHSRIDDGLNEASSLGIGAVRAHTLGISVGCPTCIEPNKGQYNSSAFESIDYAVKTAGLHGVKLMIPLTDQWHYYHGGKHTFTGWEGYNDVGGSANAGNNQQQKAIEAHFYSDPRVIADFEDYISHVLNHVNQYTGVALKNDPTVMSWETGNELFDAPTAWTEQIASYIKNTLGAKQLVADGSAASGNHTTNAALSAPDVDIVGGHFYAYPSGLDTNWLNSDAATAASSNKVYVIGEYAWTRSDVAPFLQTIESNRNVSGDMLWVLLPHLENGSVEAHGTTSYGADDVSLYVPGVSSQMQSSINTLKSHINIMNAVAVTATPSVAPPYTSFPSPSPQPIVPTVPSSSVVTINDTVTGTGMNQFDYVGTGWQTSHNSGEYNGDDHYDASGNSRDYVSMQFNGTSVTYWYSVASHHGIAGVSIDGGPESLVDQYSSSRSDGTAHWTSAQLNNGVHTIKIRLTGNKNSHSSSNVITLDRLDIAPSSAGAVPVVPPVSPSEETIPQPVPEVVAMTINPNLVNITWSPSPSAPADTRYNI